MYENYFENIGLYLSKLQVLMQTFQEQKYLPTLIPMLDEYDAYRNVEDIIPENNFKVIDAHGNVLLLRSDATLALARMMKSYVHNFASPLRLYYFNNVARPAADEKDIDILQIGIELVGSKSAKSDLEIMLLLDTALQKLDIPTYKIHLGSIAIADIFFASNKSYAEKLLYHKALSERNLADVSKYIGKKNAALLLYICASQNANSFVSRLKKALPKKNAKNTKILDDYQGLVEALQKSMGTQKVLCDLSEVGEHNYYTGIVFNVYMDQCPSPIACGGRYDSLLEKFNISAGACGGTIFPHTFSEYLLSGYKKKVGPQTQQKTQQKRTKQRKK